MIFSPTRTWGRDSRRNGYLSTAVLAECALTRSRPLPFPPPSEKVSRARYTAADAMW